MASATVHPRTRSQVRRQIEASTSEDSTLPAHQAPPSLYIPSNRTAIEPIPPIITPSIAKNLPPSSITILQLKQHWLLTHSIPIPFHNPPPQLRQAISAALVFAQEEAGTAVCISDSGILFTCSHCIAETERQLERDRTKWLIFASGQVVRARCFAWDSMRDLALLSIEALQVMPNLPGAETAESTASFSFPHVSVSRAVPVKNQRLLCIGHPGDIDLECDEPGRKTNYDIMHASRGYFHGYAPGQDLQDNSEIGALRHDCWTYWGHSGAPLIDMGTGFLVGIHSSWDDETGMRRGIALEAITEFLREALPSTEHIGVNLIAKP